MKIPHHTYTATPALASDPCPCRIQNLLPQAHVSHPFWNLSITHVIHGYTMTRGDFAVIRTNLKFVNHAFSIAGPTE